MCLRDGLDNNEEVNWSRILEESKHIIGYDMDSSPVMIYTTTKTSPMENFKHG